MIPLTDQSANEGNGIINTIQHLRTEIHQPVICTRSYKHTKPFSPISVDIKIDLRKKDFEKIF